MLVAPAPPSRSRQVYVAPLAKSLSTLDHVQAIAGLVYIVVSLACGAWYVFLLFPNMSNDHYLAQYNVSGFEAFLIDLVNVKLQFQTPNATVVDLLAPDAVLPKSYAGLVVQPSFESTYARRVLYSELNTLPWAIQNIRNTSQAITRSIYANYCWVDFDRRWDITHSMGRSLRCQARYTDDAAKYLETLVRNIDWRAFLQVNAHTWPVVIGNALLETEAGSKWLADRPREAMRLSIPDEVVYLHSINVTRYVLQYQNDYYNGLAEVMELENTLGLRHLVPLKAISKVWGPWTTLIVYWNFRNDLHILDSFNVSLVRGSANFVGNNNYAISQGMDMSAMYGICDPNGHYEAQANLFYTQIGPFGSVDAIYVTLPPSLNALYDAFVTTLFEFVWSSPSAEANFEAMPSLVGSLLPPAFAGPSLTYFGGNLLCLNNPPTSNPQSQYLFDDACATTTLFQMTASSKAILFAMYLSAASDTAAICAIQTPMDANKCDQSLTRSQTVWTPWINSFPHATFRQLKASASSALPAVAFFQYAQNATSDWLFLRQPLLTSDNPNWSFYGWLAVFDWIEGKREVIQLEGNVDTVIVMSDVAPELNLVDSSSSNDESQGLQGNELMFYAVVYTSTVATVLGVTVLCYAAKSKLHVAWRHLLAFNRVAGSVWIGRPLLLMRGFTAMLLLSTTQNTLVRDHSLSKFQFTPRSVVDTMVLAGETTWVTYVVSDMMLVATGGAVARMAAPLASGVAWLIALLLSLQYPIHLTATLRRDCSVVEMEYTLHCHSGVVQTGSLARMQLLFVIQTTSVVFLSVGVGLICGRRMSPNRRTQLLLHGAADAFFDTSRHRDIILDDASCVMTGLVPWPGHPTVAFDVKLWVVVRNAPHFLCSPATSLNTTPTSATSQCAWTWRSTAAVGVGLAYVCLTATGSISYIAVSSVNFANDFNWATFNLTGHHVAMANWFNEQLVLGRTLPEFRFDEPRWSTMQYNFSTSTSQVQSAPWVAPRLQMESSLTSMAKAIQGLRQTEPCATPWIFTQYCWVDFGKRWPLANTNARQTRCMTFEAPNAAVYLESILRNTDWRMWSTCWGDAFHFAVELELSLSKAGQEWLTQVRANANTTADEVAYWTEAGLTHYTVQWQNFKTTGLINSYTIENALGVKYPMTLIHTNGSYRIGSQTSYKMYWGLANDWWAIGQNSTLVGGKSLIRTSAKYAFANTSMVSLMVQNVTLASPLAEAFQLVEFLVGPLGSIDMKAIPCPASVKQLVASGL
ncbi:hypothetical protein As57867_001285, partial [Aphanomyces stellatus]